MTWNNFNNIGIGAVAISSALNHHKTLSLPKSLLVLPLIMHRESLSFLSNKRNGLKSIAALTATHPELFFNFDKRYESTLAASLNSIQLLIELKWITHSNGCIHSINELEIDSSFGKRAIKIAQASEKISHIFNSSDEELYLNLRIKL